MNTPQDVFPNIQLGISVLSTMVIVFNFYYMEFSPGLLQNPPPWGDTFLGVQSHIYLNNLMKEYILLMEIYNTARYNIYIHTWAYIQQHHQNYIYQTHMSNHIPKHISNIYQHHIQAYIKNIIQHISNIIRHILITLKHILNQHK